MNFHRSNYILAPCLSRQLSFYLSLAILEHFYLVVVVVLAFHIKTSSIKINALTWVMSKKDKNIEIIRILDISRRILVFLFFKVLSVSGQSLGFSSQSVWHFVFTSYSVHFPIIFHVSSENNAIEIPLRMPTIRERWRKTYSFFCRLFFVSFLLYSMSIFV